MLEAAYRYALANRAMFAEALSTHIRLSLLALALFDSDTYNRGRTFIAPLPVAAYELGPLTLNFVYLPKFRDVNPVSTLGFWATIWPARREAAD